MTESEWLSSTDPAEMLKWLRTPSYPLGWNDTKWQLWYDGCIDAKADLPAARADLLRCIFNPFCGAGHYRPTWAQSSTVLSLARAIHESGDYSRMPILTDALEEAGMGEMVPCSTCGGSGIAVYGRDGHLACLLCNATGLIPNPILAHYRGEVAKCDVGGTLVWTACEVCHGTGERLIERIHCRGCWVIDLILGVD